MTVIQPQARRAVQVPLTVIVVLARLAAIAIFVAVATGYWDTQQLRDLAAGFAVWFAADLIG